MSEPFRTAPRPNDRDAVKKLVTETGVFSGVEVGWTVEIIDTALSRGPAAGYYFQFADGESGLDGFTCFGPIDGTDHRFDLFWIAVSPRAQGKGLGRRLLAATMGAARKADATHMFIDTSTRKDYAAARALYEALGFTHMGTLVDYYSDGDGKAFFGRKL